MGKVWNDRCEVLDCYLVLLMVMNGGNKDNWEDSDYYFEAQEIIDLVDDACT